MTLTLMIGLRGAVMLLFLARFGQLISSPRATSPAEWLRRGAEILLCLAIVFGFSLPRMSQLLGHEWDAGLATAFRLSALVGLIAAAIIDAAAQGFRRGGSRRDVQRGVAVHLVLVAACLVAAALR